MVIVRDDSVQLANQREPIQIAPGAPPGPPRTDAVEALSDQSLEIPGYEPEIDSPIDSAIQESGPSSPALLRAAYVLIFFLAMLVSYTVWPQAGGQGHLDLMPWYWKLFPPLAFSYAVVRACMASGEQDHGWNRKSIAWLMVALLFASLIGGLTYYYHLQEPADQIDSDNGVITSVQVPVDRVHASRSLFANS